MGQFTLKYLKLVVSDFKIIQEEFPELYLKKSIIFKKVINESSITGHISVPQSIMKKLQLPTRNL